MHRPAPLFADCRLPVTGQALSRSAVSCRPPVARRVDRCNGRLSIWIPQFWEKAGSGL